MENQDGSGETICDLSQARIAPYQNTWKPFQNTVFWFNLKLALQRGLQFYQTRSNAIILYETLLAEFIEKAICMTTKDQLFLLESLILRPRVVLKANSHCSSQDLLVPEARSSRTPGFSISTVKLQDARRQNNLTELMEMFENNISIKNSSLKT